MPVKDNLDTSELDDAIKEMNEVLTYEDFAGASRDVLGRVHTHEELEKAREAVFAARDKLLKQSEEFRRNHQARMEQTRLESASRRAETSYKYDELRSKYPMPTERIAPVRLPNVLEAELVWVCLECGTENVNYKSIKGRKNQRKFVKRYIEMMKELKMPLEYREAKNIIKRGVPYCIMCSQRKGRDVYMVRRPLREVQKIEERLHEEKIKRPIKVLTRKQKERNIKRLEKQKKPDKKRGKD
jgi:hypothetical protein